MPLNSPVCIYVKKRINALRKLLSTYNCDACLIQSEDNLFYFLDKRIEGALLVLPNACVVISDRRYKEELEPYASRFSLVFSRSYLRSLHELVERYKIRSLGIEESIVPVSLYESLQAMVKTAVPVGNAIERLRMVKSAEEIRRIRKAVSIAGESIDFLRQIVAVGKTEKSLEAEILRFCLLKGADEPSFPPIVLSGKNTSLVHGRPSSRRLHDNEHVLVDFGVRYRGYCSDLTRIFCLGRIPSYIKDTIKLVLEAQEIAFKSIREGQFLSSVEIEVRRFFKKHRKEKYFYHSLGHGLGIEVHEKPFFSEKNRELTFREGMVVTVEPGLYFEGKFGVRIEDVVLITRKGVEILSGDINKSI